MVLIENKNPEIINHGSTQIGCNLWWNHTFAGIPVGICNLGNTITNNYLCSEKLHDRINPQLSTAITCRRPE